MWFPLGRIFIEITVSTMDSVTSVFSLVPGFMSSIPECTKHLPKSLEDDRSKNLKYPSVNEQTIYGLN